MTKTHEHNLDSIETLICQAKERRAKHIAEVMAPVFKTVGGFALVIVMVPWHALRHTLTALGS